MNINFQAPLLRRAVPALAVLTCLGTEVAALPFGSTQTVNGTIDGASCDNRSPDNNMKITVGVPITLPGRSRLTIRVVSDAGVRQSYTISTYKYCLHVPVAGTINNFKSDFPRKASIEIQLRTSKHPDLCESSGPKGDLITSLKNSYTCSYAAGIKSILVSGRKVY